MILLISTKPLWGFSSSNPYPTQSRAEQLCTAFLPWIVCTSVIRLCDIFFRLPFFILIFSQWAEPWASPQAARTTLRTVRRFAKKLVKRWVSNSKPVLRIRDILVWIRISGFVPLTNHGSGSDSGSCYFRQWHSRWQLKINIFLCFLLITFWICFYITFQRWTVIKKS